MNKIESFKVDHTKFGIGMYVSRIDGDIVTYDVRMVKPNGGKYLSSPSMHTIEHLFATFARNSDMADKVIYVGPMGCRTGFYLLLRDDDRQKALNLVINALSYIKDYKGEIPGNSEVECGNYREHNLTSANSDVIPLLNVLLSYNVKMMDYTWHFAQNKR